MRSYHKKRHSGAKKRFITLKGGEIKGSHQGRRKKLIKKTSKRKRGLRKPLYLQGRDHARVASVLY